MTPLQIRMMLHYYAIAEPYAQRDPDHRDSPAVNDQRLVLQRCDLIVASEKSPSGYEVTPRGRAYVDALQEMPLPVCTWVIPSKAA